MAKAAKRPRSLGRYLEKEYRRLFVKYKKLVYALQEAGVDEIYQFRQGVRRLEKQLGNDVSAKALRYWGLEDIEREMRKVGFQNLFWSISREVSYKRAVQRAIQARTLYGPSSPCPTDTLVEALEISEDLHKVLKSKKIIRLHALVGRPQEWFDNFYSFSVEQKAELDAALEKLGLSL